MMFTPGEVSMGIWRHRRCSLKYHLPVSCVRFKGDVTYTTDQFAADPTKPKESAKATATLEVMAASDPPLVLDVRPRHLCDTKISVAVTDDLRLTTAGFSSTGQAGPVLLAVAGAAATVMGALTGQAGLASAGAAATLDAARGAVEGFATGAEPDITKSVKEAPRRKDPWQEYKKEQPEQAALLESCRMSVANVEKTITAEAAKAGTGSEIDRLALLRSLEKTLAIAQAELDRLNLRYDTWRASKTSTWVEQHEYVLSLDDLSKGFLFDEDGTLTFDGDEPVQKMQELIWDTLGIAVHAGRGFRPDKSDPGQSHNQVIIRIPGLTQLKVYEKVDGKPRLVESRPYLTMDRDCATQAIALHGSLFGKKADDITFSALGGLATYSTERTAGSAGLAETLGKLPETVGAGLEQSGKLLDQVSGLKGRALAEQLAVLQAQIDLKKAEIAMADLGAS
jgi:hypothetical protein